jgi:hypothetical protein
MRKIAWAIFFFTFAAQVFAQTISEAGARQNARNFAPQNAVTFDIAPVFAGVFFDEISSRFDDRAKAAKDASLGGGFAMQYERLFSDKWSVAGRFSYFGANTYVRFAEMSIRSFSLEAHARYYPFAGIFFVDGMFGYTRVGVDLRGRAIHARVPSVNMGPMGSSPEVPATNMSLAENYIKLGAKLGWKIDLPSNANRANFFVEPSLGYAFALRVGGGDGFSKAGEYNSAPPAGGTPWDTYQPIDGPTVEKNVLNAMARHIFVGGAKLSLAFGYKF